MYRHGIRVLMVFVFMGLLLPGHLLASSPLLDNLKINGFLSQGYINSSGNNYYGDTKDGTFQLNEVGLALNSQVNERLRVGLQLLSRDVGRSGNNTVRLDWAFADYHFDDKLGFRIGKVKMPMGLYNDGRDSDFLRPMAFLPQSIYDEVKRDLLVANQGVAIYGNLPGWFLGNLDYQAFAGENNFPDDSPLLLGLKQAATPVASVKGYGTVTDISADNKYVFGGSLILNTSIDGLRIGASYFRGKADLYLTTITGPSQFLPAGEIEMVHRFVYSLEYVKKLFTFAAEYSESYRKQQIFGTSIYDAPSQEYYAMLTVNLTNKLSLTGLADFYYDNKHDRRGESYTAPKVKIMAWQKDYGVGTRYDVNQNWCLKAEWHEVDGAGLFTSIFNPQGPSSLVKDWNYYILKASFNF
jgi:hypothetical protein